MTATRRRTGPANRSVLVPVLPRYSPVRRPDALDRNVAHRRDLRGPVPVPRPSGDDRDLPRPQGAAVRARHHESLALDADQHLIRGVDVRDRARRWIEEYRDEFGRSGLLRAP